MKKFLSLLWKIWLKIGEVLGWVWTRIILTIIYFFVIGPIAILMKILNKDPLKFNFDKNSYWLTRPIHELKEEDYYHQF